MNAINIQYLEALNNANAQIASVLLSAEKENHYIDNINWPLEFSYCPDSKFIIARSESALYIKFQIKETNIRSLYTNDQEAVWEDSCVEFFCKKQQSDTYMNFEFNCIGTCVATTRKGRDIDVVPFSEDQLKQIERFSPLYKQPFPEKEGINDWELTIKIPFEILGINSNELPDILQGNFYKCADGTSTSHYVSWNPISTKTPDFHCPEFFGKLVLVDKKSQLQFKKYFFDI
jgi:hypothetical protein